MTAVGSTGSPERARRVDPGASEGLHWWREVLLAAVFYAVYSQVRNLFGAGPESRTIAFRHARGVIEVEEWVGLWFEPRLQQWYLALPHDGLIRFWNIFYGTAHFVVTIGVLVLAYRRLPQRYRFIRTMLAGTTALALVGFATYTLMPPRLLDVDSAFGACKGQGAECHGYGIVDTIEVWGGLWSFGEGAMAEISNQYAAMPSLHFGRSSWCAITMVMVILVMGGMALCDRIGGHISVDIFERHYPALMNRIVDIASALLGAVIFAFICWAVWDSARISVMLNLSTNLLKLPKAEFQYALIALSAVTSLGLLLRAAELAISGRDIRLEKDSA